MPDWSLVYRDFNPAEEKLREALCTLGNGYFATRGAAPEAAAGDVHYPGTYLAGGYNRLTTVIAGRPVENEDLVNMPNWLALTFRIEDGDWFNLFTVRILAYSQELDIRRGLLTRTVRFRDKNQRETTLVSRRLVHMRDPHLAALETLIVPENWSGRMQVRTALDGGVLNTGVERYKALKSRHLESLNAGDVDEETLYLLVRTNQSCLLVAEAARTRVYSGDGEKPVERRLVDGPPGWVGQDIFLVVKRQERVRVEKIVALFTSRDRAACEPRLEAIEAVGRAAGFEALLEGHVGAWDQLWGHCDIKIGGGTRMQMILRLHIFHLLQTVSPHSIDLDAGVPARGWHGEAYRGHIFWDELFIFPFLNLRVPEITRALLLYRYRRLNRARINAVEQGLKGALYPWQSGSNGREETQTLHLNPRSGRWLADATHLQRHVNAAIAYNIWHYFETTGDLQFLSTYGAEMVLEIARMFASLTTFNRETNRYEIHGVMGPDEYQDRYFGSDNPGLRNNAYTNVMASWVFKTALRILETIHPQRATDLGERLGLREWEVGNWRKMSCNMRVDLFDGGIISQFEGYENLEEFDWEGYRQKYGNIQRLDRILEAEGNSPNRYRVSKQADVLMLFYLFSTEQLQGLFTDMNYTFDPLSIPRNVRFYTERTSNGSTLSNVVHSWVLSRAARGESWNFFSQALESDIADIQGGTTREGIHLGAMAGTVDMVQRCYTGLEFRDDGICLNPNIPKKLGRISLKIQYRGNWLEIDAGPKSVTVTSRPCEIQGVRISFKEEVYRLDPGGTITFHY
ncbi:MAG TPA: glycosyl hydrolase family 65 protein [Syntrophales bacterium]|nr:glycosyl hydrolase family 65 protein [Syntrophales bacterium]HOX94220.1 glycosyl hydrolase family 65 protein [Syntrophales bacterium]HPI58149.1 glycosyl hydrolase family 65 protein [Syntrophales bacterium]HPN25977.1 glycosyl hydrolase family 65 protein [Syntrophales bacterium]HQM30197.1 glycosyl hydrolase family 65 protein [Syntrophales bacterium]